MLVRIPKNKDDTIGLKPGYDFREPASKNEIDHDGFLQNNPWLKNFGSPDLIKE